VHGAIEKLDVMASVAPRGPNPFILVTDGHDRFMRSQGHCVAARLVRRALER
jgi:hypothetical protein